MEHLKFSRKTHCADSAMAREPGVEDTVYCHTVVQRVLQNVGTKWPKREVQQKKNIIWNQDYKSWKTEHTVGHRVAIKFPRTRLVTCWVDWAVSRWQEK